MMKPCNCSCRGGECGQPAEFAIRHKDQDEPGGFRCMRCYTEQVSQRNEAWRERYLMYRRLRELFIERDGGWRNYVTRGRAAHAWKACAKKWRRIVKEVDAECAAAYECELTAKRALKASEQALSDARAALRTIGERHSGMVHDGQCPGRRHDDGDCGCPDVDGLIHERSPCVDGECECCLSVDVIAQALAGTTAPEAVPAARIAKSDGANAIGRWSCGCTQPKRWSGLVSAAVSEARSKGGTR